MTIRPRGGNRACRIPERATGARAHRARVALLAAAVGLAGCGSGGPVGLANARPGGVERVWPRPPDDPKVRLVATFSTASHLGFGRSFFRRIADVVFGGDRQNRIQQPYGVTVGPDGSIYVVDSAAGGVHAYDLDDAEYRLVGAEELRAPIGVAVSPEGLLFVSDPEQARIVIFDGDGRVVRSVDQGLVRPTGLAWDAFSGTVLAVDTGKHEIVRLSPAGEIIDRFGRRGTGDGEFNYPTNVAVGPLGRVYVSDTMNFRVQVLDEFGVFMGQFGEMGTSQGQFARPKGVGINASGHVFVVEGLYDVVNIFDADGRLLLTFGGAGRERGSFWLASGLTVDDEGRIYVADTYNRRIQVFEIMSDEEAV